MGRQKQRSLRPSRRFLVELVSVLSCLTSSCFYEGGAVRKSIVFFLFHFRFVLFFRASSSSSSFLGGKVEKESFKRIWSSGFVGGEVLLPLFCFCLRSFVRSCACVCESLRLSIFKRPWKRLAERFSVQL